jgi:tetratricopeptide (TPR) repeat protein
MMRSYDQRMLLALLLTLAAASCAPTALTTRHDAQPALTREQVLAVAELAERTGDNLRAQQYLLTALKAGAAPELVLPRLLRLYVADGQYRLAIDTLKDFLRHHPQHYRLRLLLADLYAATQLTAAAAGEYERVLAAAPAYARAHFSLASLLYEAGDAGRADPHYRAYLASAPHGRHADEARSHLSEWLP